MYESVDTYFIEIDQCTDAGGVWSWKMNEPLKMPWLIKLNSAPSSLVMASSRRSSSWVGGKAAAVESGVSLRKNALVKVIGIDCLGG